MRKILVSLALTASCVWGADGEERRWVFVSTSLTEAHMVNDVSNVLACAKVNGMNGVALSAGLDFLRFWSPERRGYLRDLKRVCDGLGMEIVPVIWSLGHGALQNYGVNLLEAMPVEGLPFVAHEGKASFDSDAAASRTLDPTAGWQREKGYYRMIQTVSVKPHRRYRLTCEFRTQDFIGTSPLEILARNAKAKSYYVSERFNVPFRPTQAWTPVTLDFCSGESDSYYLYLGFMSGWKSGSLEIRRLQLAETAPEHVIRRPGAPCRLRNPQTGKTYAYGVDYTVPKPGFPVWKITGHPVGLTLPKGSSIRPGERLTFDCHVAAVVDGNQVSLCLSEPDLYERVLADSAAQLEAELHPRIWHISGDEFRNGNHCAACRARKLSMAEIYADAITRMHGIVRKVHPGAEVMVWSDMLDPNHNAVASYYNCLGSFENGWKGIPKDIVICCWYGDRCEASLKFFSDRGFRTLGAAYYDEPPPFARSRRWREALRVTPGATGVMYATWRNAYGDLPAFCELFGFKKGAVK